MITSRIFFVAVGLIVLATALQAQPVSGPGGNYWPLFCKTGPNVKVEVDNTSNLRVFFESSGKPAGANFAGVTPGTCSYPDRVPRKDELQGFYGELFVQWRCPALMGTCLVKYDANTHTYKGDFPWFKDPAGRKFKVWVRKENGFMQILGESSPKFEFVN
ncbi:MAG: hypothetical protein K8S54_13385 [Spirochaetia bacterium]|nr:hypothetical protein [Spirochaetia bacterium]